MLLLQHVSNVCYYCQVATTISIMNRKTHTVLDLQKFLPYRISVIEQQISRAIAERYSAQHDLTRFEWRVLATLGMFENITAKDVCEFTLMEKMQVSRAINSLQRKDLITQQKNPHDNRNILLNLSDKGQQLYLKIVPGVLEEEQKIFSVLSNDELQAFNNIVEKLCQSIRVDQ